MGKFLCPLQDSKRLTAPRGLTFLSSQKSSGHMVPQFRPQAALHMLDKLLRDEMLSPLLPSNQTIATADQNDFRDMMEKWTESAMAAPYVG